MTHTIQQSQLFELPAVAKTKENGTVARKAFKTLLNGGSVVDATIYGCGYRVYDAEQNVVLKMHARSFDKIRHLLRANPRHPDIYQLSKATVRKMHGSTFYKRLYKIHLLKSKNQSNDSIRKNSNATASL